MHEKELINKILLGIKIKDLDPLEWALENNQNIDGKDPIEWALDNNQTIEGRQPIEWLSETSSQRKADTLLTNDLVMTILKHQYPGERVEALAKDYEASKSASHKLANTVKTLVPNSLQRETKPEQAGNAVKLIREELKKGNLPHAMKIADELLQTTKPNTQQTTKTKSETKKRPDLTAVLKPDPTRIEKAPIKQNRLKYTKLKRG